MRLATFLISFLLGCSTILAEPFATFFPYSSEELEPLKELPSEWTVSQDEMKKWDAVAAGQAFQKKIDFYDGIRLFTYLYLGQADFAYLSHNLNGRFKGSLDPISHRILGFFITGYEPPKSVIDDPYSEALAKVIFMKIIARLQKESAQAFEFDVPKDLQNIFSAGLQVAKWIPWFAKPSIDYWPPPPPAVDSPIWKEQARLIAKEQYPLTEEKKRAVYRWAGLGYPWSDDARTIANNFLWCQQVPLLKSLQVRSMLMAGMYDCLAAYVTCKYKYLVARPKTVDPAIIYVIPVPKHPSYPAGHAAEASLSSNILSFFFPSHAEMWQRLAAECSQSRIWAGIHFPLDNQAGVICGKKVAQKEIEVFTQANPGYRP